MSNTFILCQRDGSPKSNNKQMNIMLETFFTRQSYNRNIVSSFNEPGFNSAGNLNDSETYNKLQKVQSSKTKWKYFSTRRKTPLQVKIAFIVSTQGKVLKYLL